MIECFCGICEDCIENFEETFYCCVCGDEVDDEDTLCILCEDAEEEELGREA
jgi:hypothetical protein